MYSVLSESETFPGLLAPRRSGPVRRAARLLLAGGLAAAMAGGGGWLYCGYAAARREAVRAELSQLPRTSYAPQRVVYHLTEDGGLLNRRSFGRLGSLANHVAAVGAARLDLRVVLQGDGLHLLQDASRDPALAAAIGDLRRQGVRFLVCRNSMIDHGIRPSDLYGVVPADLVTAAVAEIAALETAGFVYLRL